MADGLFYRDLRQPFVILDQTAITLAATQKALWAPALTALPANYWTVGKAVKLTAWGKMTTVLTPGNLTFSVAYGTGDAPTPIKTSVAAALIASKTDLSWKAEAYAVCRSTGPTGTLMVYGSITPHVGLVASTAQPILVPDSANTALTIDTTAGTNALTMQAARSGSTAETMTTQGLFMEALN